MVSSSARMASWDDAPLPYQSLDGDACIIDVNAHWTAFSGYSADEAIGKAYVDFVPEDHLDYFRETFALFAEQGYLDGRDCFFQRKDGAVRNVLIYGRLVPSEDGVVSHCMLVDVTAHRETERLLSESEERFRSLFELAPNPIVVHDSQRIVLANAAAADFLGYSGAADVIGVPVAELVDEESRSVVAERVERMLAEDWVAPLAEEYFVRPDGSVVHGEVVASPLVVGGKRLIHVAVVDVTARDRAEEALKESESRFRQLFEAAADGIAVHDGTTVLLANEALREYLAFPADQALDSFSIRDLVPVDAQRAVGERIRGLLTGDTDRTAPLELQMLRADGTLWETEISSTALTFEGRRVIQTTFRDLTERRSSERELARYRVELERLVDERTATLRRVQAELQSVTAVIARTVELRDPYTAGHQRRVAELCVALARELEMPEEAVSVIHTAASIHDIGKVSVPAEILSKPGRFSPIEYELVKTHALAGYEIIASAELGGDIAEIVGQHHERLDGSGYPHGLTRDQLLPGAKLLMVADVVEAMSSHRPYRPAIGFRAAIEEIRGGKDVLYDGDVVEACVALLDRGFEFSAQG